MSMRVPNFCLVLSILDTLALGPSIDRQECPENPILDFMEVTDQPRCALRISDFAINTIKLAFEWKAHFQPISRIRDVPVNCSLRAFIRKSIQLHHCVNCIQ